MGEKNIYRVLVGKFEGKNHLKDLGVDGMIQMCKRDEMGYNGMT